MSTAASALIVDDSASMRMVVNTILKEAGYSVTEALDGLDGLSKAKHSRFDVVITDINMPGIHGIEFIRKLRDMPDYSHTPILTLTTENTDKMKTEGKSAGATGWIVKPFSPEKLLAALKRLLN